MKRNVFGFTLLEMLVALSIMLVLSATLIITVPILRHRAQLRKAQADIEAISAAIELFRMDTGRFPRSTSVTAYNATTAPTLEPVRANGVDLVQARLGSHPLNPVANYSATVRLSAFGKYIAGNASSPPGPDREHSWHRFSFDLAQALTSADAGWSQAGSEWVKSMAGSAFLILNELKGEILQQERVFVGLKDPWGKLYTYVNAGQYADPEVATNYPAPYTGANAAYYRMFLGTYLRACPAHPDIQQTKNVTTVCKVGGCGKALVKWFYNKSTYQVYSRGPNAMTDLGTIGDANNGKGGRAGTERDDVNNEFTLGL